MTVLTVFSSPASADTGLETQVSELKQLVQELRRTVDNQQREIDALKAERQVPEPAAEAEAIQEAVPAAPAMPGSATRGRWNPDIGVIADVLFQTDDPKTDGEGSDRVSVRELELILGSYVDPYSRLDVNIAFTDLEEVHLQEAYLTRFALPWETTARVGRFKPKAGKALSYHRDVLDTADYPLAVRRYFGDDGLNKTGVDLTKPLDVPFDSAHEVTFGVLEGANGEGGSVFGDSRRRPTLYSHLKNFWDLSDVTSFELGASHLAGSADADSSFETNVAALDGTLIHLYGPDQRIKLQSEFFYVDRDESVDASLFGAYGLFDVRFHKQWSAGFRTDYVERVDSSGSEEGYTGYLTFYQTEFARWRVQATHLEFPDGRDDDQVMIQGIFAIGEHKHKLT